MKKNTFIFIVILVVLLFLGIIFRLIVNTISPPTSSQPNFDNSKSSFSRVVFIGQKPNTQIDPVKVRAKIIKEPLDKLINNFVEKYELTAIPDNPDIYTSESNNTILFIFPEENRMKFSDGESNYEWVSEIMPGADEENLKKIADNLNTELLGELNNLLELTSIQHFEHMEIRQTTSAGNARLSNLNYNYTINSTPIIFTSTGNNSVSYTITSEESVKSIELTPLNIDVLNEEVLEPISIDEAIININNNNAFVANASGSVGQIMLQEITSAMLNSVSVEYPTQLSAEIEHELVPHYRFRGVAKNRVGQEFEIDILTPAGKMRSN